MSERTDDLLCDWLDSPETRHDANETSAVSSEMSEHIAESLLIHGLLVDIGEREEDQITDRITALMHRIDAEPYSLSKTTGVYAFYRRRSFAILTSALSIAAAAILMFVLLVPSNNVSAAMASLEKIVSAAAQPQDRTYNVRVVEEYSRDRRPRNLSPEAWDRESKKQLDGATLYVRGANQHVMTVMLKSGEKRTSGCDGTQSWAFRESGPVHISTDLNRFRGGVPGQQQDFPFLNIHAHLARLQTGYDIELRDQPTVAETDALTQLTCTRKSRDVRGPKQVEIWFDSDSGTVHEMLLDGLPRGGGGPKSVRLTLVDQSELPAGFFSHQTHHEPERRVIRE